MAISIYARPKAKSYTRLKPLISADVRKESAASRCKVENLPVTAIR